MAEVRGVGTGGMRARRRGALRLIGVPVLAGALAACGGTPVAPPPAPPPPPPLVFSRTVPARPNPVPLWTDQAQAVDAVAGDGIIAVRTGGDEDRLRALDARSGAERWAAPLSGDALIASDAAGPGDPGSGVIFATEEVPMPQNGLTPAAVRTDVVARESVDGRERWRVEVLKEATDKDPKNTVVAMRARTGALAVVTTRTLRVLDAGTGRKRWQATLSLSPFQSGVGTDEGFVAVALGPGTVAVTARLPGDQAVLRAYELVSGKLRWSKRSTEDLDRPPLGQVEISADRVVVEQWTSPGDGQSSDKMTIQAYNLDKGAVAWHNGGTDDGRQLPLSMDYGDGTILRTQNALVRALNIRTGQVRWQQPDGVEVTAMTAAGGASYFIATSGGDRQVVVLESRTGKQRQVLPGSDAKRLKLFPGVAVVLSDSETALYI